MIERHFATLGIASVDRTSLHSTRQAPMVQESSNATAVSFEKALTELAAQSVQTVRTAEAASKAGIAGQMPVQQVVSSVMEAERSLQVAISVRDKVVAAYLEISRMQI